MKNKNLGTYASYGIIGLSLISGLVYFVYNIFFTEHQSNHTTLIINSFILLLLTAFLVVTLFFSNEKNKTMFTNITALCLISFIGFNFLVSRDVLDIPAEDIVVNFVGKSINEGVTWASENKIEVEQSYAYSDDIEEYIIISQDVLAGTLTKDVSKIKFIVSSGPNYDRTTVVSNMLGWQIDDVLTYINENFLNNVIIEFVESEEEKDTVISQSKTGEMRRNDELVITFSIGSLNDLNEIEMINLDGKSLFEATLFLKRNGVKYKIEYEFSDTVLKDYVISSSIKEGTMIGFNSDDIILNVSKGKEITVPNLSAMNSAEITDWVINNNLKISFIEEYHESIALGNVISSNYKENDKISDGTLIEVIISKGPLKMEKFTKINEFREWASKYKVAYEEEYKFNDNVPSGNIIETSLNVGDIIKSGEKIYVTVSQGEALTIPNFVGKSKSYISSKCSELGLKCSFSYSGYSSAPKDEAVKQNKKAGGTVSKGTALTIYLSNGPAKEYKIFIQDSWWDASINSADAGIAMLKRKLGELAPGVTFKFAKKASNGLPSGYIHKDSAIQGLKYYTVKQGSTYTITINS